MTSYLLSLKDELGEQQSGAASQPEVDGMNSTLVGHELAPRTAKEWFR